MDGHRGLERAVRADRGRRRTGAGEAHPTIGRVRAMPDRRRASRASAMPRPLVRALRRRPGVDRTIVYPALRESAHLGSVEQGTRESGKPTHESGRSSSVTSSRYASRPRRTADRKRSLAACAAERGAAADRAQAASTHDIPLSPSRLRGVILGEKRVTEGGTPAVCAASGGVVWRSRKAAGQAILPGCLAVQCREGMPGRDASPRCARERWCRRRYRTSRPSPARECARRQSSPWLRRTVPCHP